MEQEPFFHFFRDYETIITIQHIGQKINYLSQTLTLNFTFSMDFDNKRYKFIGYCNDTEQIPFHKFNDIQQILLFKPRPVKLLGTQYMTNEILIDLKFTEVELNIFKNQSQT